MTEDEIIEVLQAFKEGKVIEYRSKIVGENFVVSTSPNWNFGNYDYRIKSQPEYVAFEHPVASNDVTERNIDTTQPINKAEMINALCFVITTNAISLESKVVAQEKLDKYLESL